MSSTDSSSLAKTKRGISNLIFINFQMKCELT